VNPAMAIIFESFVFGGVVALVADRIKKSAFTAVWAGVAAGMLSAVAWVYFAIYVMNAPAYARVVFTAGGYISEQGVAQAVFFGIFVPAGLFIGERLANKHVPALFSKAPAYYAASLSIIAFCWVISALVVNAGL